MPDEQIGLGPAALENPEEGNTTSREGTVEAAPIVAEQEPVAPEKGGKYEKLLSHVTQATAVVTAPSDGDATQDAAQIQGLEEEGQKIEQLVKLTQTKGLAHAVRVAEQMKDFYALDKFHDELVDNLYEELLKQGLITKE